MFRKQVKCYRCGFLAVKGFESFIKLGDRNELRKLQILREYGATGLLECPPEGRKNIAEGCHKAPCSTTCAKNMWDGSDFKDKNESYVMTLLNSERNCPYFFPYNPGYSPAEHKELQRERDQRHFLIVATLLSAAVGAGIATLANLYWSLR